MSRAQFTRRRFLGSLGGALAAGLAGGQAGCDRSLRPPDDAPDVLFIVIDDLNDWVACLGGHPDARTPHIDGLAREGTLFTRAYTSSPLCQPSRVSALSGLLPSTTGVYGNGAEWRGAVRGLPPLSEQFHANGYGTLCAGKVFHGNWSGRYDVISRLPWWLGRHFMADQWGAWDDFFSWQDSPRPERIPANGVDEWFDWAALPIPDEEMGDVRVAEWVGDQLHRAHPSPFFLACGIYRPHLPWYVPSRYFDQHPRDALALPPIRSDDLVDVPPTARRWVDRMNRNDVLIRSGKVRDAVRAYLASVSFADACVGRVIAALKASPYASRTIVVLWSDHGFHLGEKLLWDKRVLWEEATHVPLIVTAPGFPSNQRCERTVSLVDLYPTLLELCGVARPGGLDGASLVPLLEDPGRPWKRPALSTFERGNHSLRSERWRYTRYEDGSEELYDHAEDPYEWTNLAGAAGVAPTITELSRWLPSRDAPDYQTG